MGIHFQCCTPLFFRAASAARSCRLLTFSGIHRKAGRWSIKPRPWYHDGKLLSEVLAHRIDLQFSVSLTDGWTMSKVNWLLLLIRFEAACEEHGGE